MPLERRRPLPPGRYWADIFPQNRAAFEGWVRAMADGVRIEKTEHFAGVDGAPEHDWVLWSTNRELVWVDNVLGFAPNVAEPSVASSSDTAQRPPPPPSATDQLQSALNEISKGAKVGIGLGVAAVITAAVIAIARKR